MVSRAPINASLTLTSIPGLAHIKPTIYSLWEEEPHMKLFHEPYSSTNEKVVSRQPCTVQVPQRQQMYYKQIWHHHKNFKHEQCIIMASHPIQAILLSLTGLQWHSIEDKQMIRGMNSNPTRYLLGLFWTDEVGRSRN